MVFVVKPFLALTESHASKRCGKYMEKRRLVMKVNCIHCGHALDVGESYGTFDGLVRCYVCKGLMELKTDKGKVRAVRFIPLPALPKVEAPSVAA
jgi:hypothetical protein